MDKVKKILITFMCFAFLLGGCSQDKLIVITFKDNSVDTVMANAHHFSLVNGNLKSIRSMGDGDNFLVATNVKFYRIIQ